MPGRRSWRSRTRRTGWPGCCVWFSPRARRVPRDSRGAAALETAIVMPVILLVLFGIIDMGRLLQQYIQLTEAAREGARLGALNGTVAGVQAKVTGIVGTGGTSPVTQTVTVCTAGSQPGTDAKVVLTRQYQPITPMVALVKLVGGQTMSTITMSATGVMSCVG
ncbi:TadE/TadG family type IV pilus assembly protein [Actinoplanes sp. NPDC020271]|uniref:TadE/TadG family type IV pilus assembly protein n=1 Tax=Actinoplanes sp. NPDC020271 TaxID=3363896 RepID=UPI0037A444E4